MTLFITLILIVILGSAFFSGLEAALFAISTSKVALLREEKKRGSASLFIIKEKMSRPITVIVIFNNIFNIVGSIYVGVVAATVFGSAALGLISVFLTLAIIIFGEIIPKTLGENYSDKVALFCAPFLLYMTKVMLPVVWFFEQITKRLVNSNTIVSEEEIQMMSHLGHLEGSIEKDEREMIENVFLLNDISARDIMTPRSMMYAKHVNEILGDIKLDLYDEAFSRIPVYGEDNDDIVGIVYKIELLTALAKDQHTRPLSDYVKPVFFVDEDIRADHLLPLFQKRRSHLAVVKNEFGETSGIVTLEDVLEELVGEIIDETDDTKDPREEARKKLEDSEYEVEK